MLGNGLKWMFLIIGTMIGAGYASGRELWEFFGAESGLAIILFMLLFMFCCFVIMSLSHTLQSRHYLPVLTVLLGRRLAKVYDVMTFFYLFSMTIIMLAGGGATLEMIHIPYWTGVMVTSILAIILFFWDIEGMTSINALLIPLLVACLIGTLMIFQSMHDFSIQIPFTEQSNWPAALTFTALNILPLLAVLTAVGFEIKSRGEVFIASIGSGLILGGVTFFYNESLLQVAEKLSFYEIPLFAILENFPYMIILLMLILLWLAIYTSALAGLFGLISRLRERVNGPAWFVATLLVISMIPFTTFGFSTLIAILYPLYGILNLYLFATILLYPMNHQSSLRDQRF